MTISNEAAPPNSLLASTHPENWLLVAQGLLLSAEVLWAAKVAPFWDAYLKEIDQLQIAGAEELLLTPETMKLASEGYDYVFPCLLLSGYAIENTLKAIRVEQLAQQGRPAYQQTAKGTFLLPQLLSHNLLRLAQHCSITMNNSEQWLLQQLQNAVQWTGRYPLPSGVPSGPADPGAAMKMVVHGQQEDVRKMYDRLSALYLQLKSREEPRHLGESS